MACSSIWSHYKAGFEATDLTLKNNKHSTGLYQNFN